MPISPWPRTPLSACRRPAPSSTTSSSRLGRAVPTRHARSRGPGVLERVGERLLDDAVGGQIDARRERRAARPRRGDPPGAPRRAPAPRARERAEPGLGADRQLGARRSRRMPSSRRSSTSASRPLASIEPEGRRGPGRARRADALPACACTTMTLTLWATTSCSSRAMRPRSSLTAVRAFSSRSRSSRPAWSRRRPSLAPPAAQVAPHEPREREDQRGPRT